MTCHHVLKQGGLGVKSPLDLVYPAAAVVRGEAVSSRYSVCAITPPPTTTSPS